MEEEFLLNGKVYKKSVLNEYAKKNNMDFDSYIKETGSVKKPSSSNKYILNNKEYDEPTMVSYAQKNKMSLNDYIKEAGVKKKEQSQFSGANTREDSGIPAKTQPSLSALKGQKTVLDSGSLSGNKPKVSPSQLAQMRAKGIDESNVVNQDNTPIKETSAQKYKRLKGFLQNVKVTDQNSEEVNNATNELSDLVKRNNARKDALNNKLNKEIYTVDQSKIQKDVDSEKNPSLFKKAINKVTDVAGAWANRAFDEVIDNISPDNKFTEKTIPFQQYKKDLLKKNPNLPQEELDKQAEELFRQAAAKKQISVNFANKTSNLSDQEKSDLKVAEVHKIKQASDEEKGITLQINQADHNYKILDSSIKSYDAILKAHPEKQNDPEFMNQYNKSIEQVNTLKGHYIDLLNRADKIKNTKMNAQEHLGMWSTNYGPFDNFASTASNGVLKIIGKSIYWTGELDKALGGYEDNSMTVLGGKLAKYAEGNLAKVENISLEDISKSDTPIATSGKYVLQTVAGIVPYLLGGEVTAADGAITALAKTAYNVGTHGLAAAGDVAMEMNQEEKDNPKIKYSTAQKWTAMLGYAGADYMMMGGYSRVLKGGKSALEAIGKDIGAREQFEQGMKQYATDVFKGFKGGAISRSKTGAITAATEATKMFIKEAVLNQKIDNKSSKILASGLNGAVMDAILVGFPKTGGYLLNKLSPNEGVKQFRSNLAEITKKNIELQREDLSVEDREILVKWIDKFKENNETLIQKKLKDFKRLTSVQREALLNLEGRKSEIRNEVLHLNSEESTLSEEQKKDAKRELKAEWSALEDSKSKMFTDVHNSLDLMSEGDRNRLMSEAEVSLMNELNPNRDKEVKLTPEQIKDRAVEMHREEDVFSGMDIKEVESIKKEAMSNLEEKVTDKQKEEGFKISNADVVKEAVKIHNESVSESIKQEKEAEVKKQEQETPVAEEPKVTIKKIKNHEVYIDENGLVSKIINSDTGKEVPRFLNKKVIKKGVEVIKPAKNPAYSTIESEATGLLNENQSKVEREKILNETLDNFEPSNEADAVLHYFAKGRKVRSSSASGETGGSRKEMSWIDQFEKDKSKLPSVENVAEELASSHGKLNLDYNVLRQEVINLLGSVSSKREIEDKFVEIYGENKIAKEAQEAYNYLNGLSEKDRAIYESVKAEDDYISELSDEDAIKYYEEQYKLSNQENYERASAETETKQSGEAEGDSIPKGNEGEESEALGGVSQKVRRHMAERFGVELPPAGEGWNSDIVQEVGKLAEDNGSDAVSIAKKFREDTENGLKPKTNGEEMALCRYKADNLISDMYNAELLHGVDSKEFNEAKIKADDFLKDFKAMQTNWSNEGKAQMGARDLATGSFTEMSLEYAKRNNGESFDRKQTKAAKEIEGKVKKATIESNEATEKWKNEVDNSIKNEKDKEHLKYTEEEFQKELKAKIQEHEKNQKLKNQVLSKKEIDRKSELRKKYLGVFNDVSSMVTLLADKEYMEYMGLIFKQAKGDFSNFSKLAIKELGAGIKKHLPELFENVNKNTNNEKRVMSEETKRKIYVKLLNKHIDALDAQIEAKKRNVVTKVDKYKNDVEIQNLRDVKTKKQKQLSDLDPSYSDRLKLKTDLKIAQKSLDEYQKRIDNNEFSPKEKESKEVDSKLKELRDKRDSKRKEYEVKKREYKAKLEQENKNPITEDDIYKKQVDSKVAQLKKQLTELQKNEPKDNVGKKSIWSQEISNLKTKIDNLRKESKRVEVKIKEKNKKDKLQKTDKEKYNDELNSKIKSTQKQIDDFGKEKDNNGKSSVWSKDLSELKKQLNKLREEKKESDKKIDESKVNVNEPKEEIDIKSRFIGKKDNKFTTEEVVAIWGYAKKQYLDKGKDPIEMLRGVSRDLSLDVHQVNEAIASNKSVRKITGEMYLKQRKRREAIDMAKNFVKDANVTKFEKILTAVPAAFRETTTFGHFGVPMLTHGGSALYHPPTWGKWFRNAGVQYKLAMNPEFHARMMFEMELDPLFADFLKGGLTIDPHKVYDLDYESKKNIIKSVGNAGTRSYDVLKLFRMQLMKIEYNKLSAADRMNPDVIKTIAERVNNSTGSSSVSLGRGSSHILFSPKGEIARWKNVVVNPARALKTVTKIMARGNLGKVTPQEIAGAKYTAGRVGWMLATHVGFMAINAGLNSWLESDATPMNFSNPRKPDFLKFKIAGKLVDASAGTVGLISFICKIILAIEGDKEVLNQQKGDRKTALVKLTSDRGFNLLSPFAGTVKDVVTEKDRSNNIMPFSSDIPKGTAKKLSWREYLTENRAPIPVTEMVHAMHDRMKKEGMSDADASTLLDGIISGGLGGFTGIKLSEDMDVKETAEDLMKVNPGLSRAEAQKIINSQNKE